MDKKDWTYTIAETTKTVGYIIFMSGRKHRKQNIYPIFIWSFEIWILDFDFRFPTGFNMRNKLLCNKIPLWNL